MGCYINIDTLSVIQSHIWFYSGNPIFAFLLYCSISPSLRPGWQRRRGPASISNIGKRDTLWFFPHRLIKECQRLVGPISVSGQSTWGPKAGNAGAGNPSTYTMDDDDAVKASAPLSRKGGASAGKGHLFLAGFKLYNSICRRLSKTCFLCKNRITLE